MLSLSIVLAFCNCKRISGGEYRTSTESIHLAMIGFDGNEIDTMKVLEYYQNAIVDSFTLNMNKNYYCQELQRYCMTIEHRFFSHRDYLFITKYGNTCLLKNMMFSASEKDKVWMYKTQGELVLGLQLPQIKKSTP